MSIYSRDITLNVEEVEENILRVKAYMKNGINNSTKNESFQLEVFVDIRNMEIVSITNVEINGYFSICHEIANKLQGLIGIEISKGYNKRISELIGGESGCIHIVELLIEVGRCVNLAYYNGYVLKQSGIKEATEDYKSRGSIGCLGLNKSVL